LDLATPPVTLDVYLEGSPLDAAVFLILILCGIWILVKRQVNWIDVLINNYWLWLFFLFGLFSIAWSDYPLVSLKRLFKASGNVVMALVILTERRPFEAFSAVLRRLAFVLVPLSVLFIKYYPELGRSYAWGGRLMYTGVAFQKNALGMICLLSVIGFFWSLLLGNDRKQRFKITKHGLAYLALFTMCAWLIYLANSATSLVCIAVVAAIFIFSRLPVIARDPRWITIGGATTVVVFGILEYMLDVSGGVIEMVGRDPSLTTRVPMWNKLISMAVDPVLGAGYEIFWSGERLAVLTKAYEVRQAHNGYLELYLNLGLVGLGLVVGSIVSGLFKIGRYLEINYASAILRLTLVVVCSLYNWTEATFSGVSCMWTIFLVGYIDPPDRTTASDDDSFEAEGDR
jgi:hypothetical protein